MALFGSVSATRVTSHCPAGTVGLGGLGDKAGFLPAHLQAPLASESVCSTCALGLGTLPGAGRCRSDCLSGLVLGRARWRWRSLAGLSGARVGLSEAAAPGCAPTSFFYPPLLARASLSGLLLAPRASRWPSLGRISCF